MAVQKVVLLYDEQFTLTIETPVDAHEKPAKIEGTPEWATSDPNVATVTPSSDGLSCVVKGANPGTTQVSVTADADLGPGQAMISGSCDLQVDGLQAVGFKFTVGPLSKQ